MDRSRKPALQVIRRQPERQRKRFVTNVELAGANLAQQEVRILAHQQRVEREQAERERQQERKRQQALSTQERYQNRLVLRSRHQDQLARFLHLAGGSATFAEIRQGLNWTFTTLVTAAVGRRFYKCGGRVALIETL